MKIFNKNRSCFSELLFQFKIPKKQIAEWLQRLENFNLFIENRAGKHNKNAMSRTPGADYNCKHCLSL